MKRTFGILFAVVLMVVMTGNLFAQEMMGMMKEMGKEKEEVEVKKVVGTQGMMCPMCKKVMGEKGMMQGMMGGGMMSMMHGMMSGSGMMGGMQMMDAKPHIAGMAEALKLSEEQQDKLSALHIAYKKDIIRKKADREIAEIDLQELIGQDEVDLDAVEEELKEITNLEAQVKYAWVKLLVDSKSLLTAEQKAELKKLMKGGKGQMMMGSMMGDKKTKAEKPMPEAGEHAGHH